MSDVFSPDDFLNMAVEGVGSTVITPIPAGTYMALIGNDENSVRFDRKERTDGKPGHINMLSVTFEIIDDNGSLKAQIDGRDPKHTQFFFVDLGPDGKLDMSAGKNVNLNRLRSALNQNTGAPWSPSMLRGAGPVAIQMVVQPDKRDRDTPRNHIKAFGRPGELK